MAPSKKCFPLQPGAFFRFSRIFKLSQSAYTSNLPFSKLCFLPRRGTQFCFFPLLTISPKTCKSNLSEFPPFLSASWDRLGIIWGRLGVNFVPNWVNLGPTWANFCQIGGNLGLLWVNLWPILHESLPSWAQLGHRKPEKSLFFIGFSMFLICRSSCNLGANL